MSDVDFGEFSVGTEHKPVAGVVTVEIPAQLSKLLEQEVPKVMASKDLDLTLTARDEKTAKILAGYVKAWGGRQTPQLYIRRLPSRRNQKENLVRFTVALADDVPAENRPGRRAAAPEAPAKGK